MENGRKRVTVCSDSESMGPALRLLLDEFDVEVADHPTLTANNTDLLVWTIDGSVPTSELASVASQTPTMAIAEPNELIRSVDAGCRGFLSISATLEEIREGVLVIADGGAVVPPNLLGTLLRHLVDRRRAASGADDALDSLTDREREVFHLSAKGARKDEIARTLYISPATARTHLQRLYRKLGVHSQAELIALAVRIGMFDSEEDE